MDSLTQIVLGAAIGEATLGRRVGNRAILWGAVCGTLPDLDVFVPLGDAVSDFTYHRGASHSLFVLTALSPLVAWLIMRMHPSTRRHRYGWLALVWLVLVTHPLLDSFTIYGTQIFWPFDTTPVGWGSVFIIDPAYTLPLLAGVIAAMTMRRTGRGGRWNAAGLVVSSLYLCWTLGAQWWMTERAGRELAAMDLAPERLLVQPTPFNSILWRALAMDGDRYHEGFLSLLAADEGFRWTSYRHSPWMLDFLAGYWPVERLRWFTKGFYSVRVEDDAIVMSDLRMGLEPDYVFRFAVGRLGNPHPRPVPVRRVTEPRRWDRLPEVWSGILAAGAEPVR
jgi:inner membrane protein